MCGIVGLLFSTGGSSERLENLLLKMTASIAHRGPDDQGTWTDFDAGVALGHRRLSIVDLSSAGQQPMRSPSGRYVIVFNGEIYNHLDLRRDLENTKHASYQGGLGPEQSTAAGSYRGTSDTESLLSAIDAWGLHRALERCVGMFAFALWDTHLRTLTLVRDRLGEKPLYYGHHDGMFIFSSELRTFEELSGFSAQISQAALWHYMCQKAIPAPLSIYEGIHKLEPGQLLQIDTKYNKSFCNIRLERYWTIESAVAKPAFQGTAQDAVTELRRLMLDAVKGQMVADVPVGAFLSGGIDSSTVVALMQSVAPGSVQTYAIGFNEVEFNEAPHARSVAQFLGTHHHERIITSAEALEIVPQLASVWDEPFADSSQIPTAFLTRTARSDVTVALSGDGGDELFCGYKHHLTAAAIESLPRKLFLSKLLFAFQSPRAQLHIRSLPLGSRPKQIANKLRILSSVLACEHPERRYMALALQSDYWLHLMRGKVAASLDMPNLNFPAAADALTIASAIDTVTYLPTDILAKVDRAAMSVGLETRIPLLDHRIVEFAMSLPSSYKVRDGKTKWPLRQVLESYVPSSLIDRPKMGFSVPLEKWLRGPLRKWAEALLFEKTRQDNPFDQNVIQALWRDHQSHRWNYADHLWRLLMFRAWQMRDAS
ncbi:asparagine synthase (glutamine-hydrolyzing) [Microvirga lotononidis]|uniref:asparagine synthase (glutamine-hydrolyzing) n=1 Tax=Microvirga lotononidis TaxID=864069 RepID=I4YTD7_9HYPH|nr:asparagine synthase (glutamine-hydrolyzing) [Microvirga lotononidis]EIM27229.1 asparagine synthase, glutamine-hydrolyzing [Microvirga lotononidis]WQO28595.1 asparagine synthase (glutamine-hydrolyzing) [Microvirga lotononidis]